MRWSATTAGTEGLLDEGRASSDHAGSAVVRRVAECNGTIRLFVFDVAKTSPALTAPSVLH